MSVRLSRRKSVSARWIPVEYSHGLLPIADALPAWRQPEKKSERTKPHCAGPGTETHYTSLEGKAARLLLAASDSVVGMGFWKVSSGNGTS